MNYRRGNTFWNSSFLLVFIIEVMLQMGMSVINPNIANFAVSLNATITTAGLIVGLNYASSLCLRAVNGLVCDVFYKPTLLLVSCATYIVSSIGFMVSATPEMVSVFRVVQGVAFVIKSSVVISITSLVVPKEKVGQAVGVVGLGFTVGCALGPFLGNCLGVRYGYRASFLLSAFFFIVALVLALLLKEKACLERHKGVAIGIKDIIAQISPKRMFYIPALPVTFAIAFSFASQSLLLNLLLLMASVEGINGASVYYLAYALCAMLSKPLSGRFFDRYGLLRVMVPMCLLVMAAMSILAFNFCYSTILLAGILMGIGQGSVYSCLQAEAIRRAPEEKSGQAANMFYLGSDAVQFFGPFLFASLFDSFGTSVCFGFAALTPIFSVASYVVLRKIVDGEGAIAQDSRR